MVNPVSSNTPINPAMSSPPAAIFTSPVRLNADTIESFKTTGKQFAIISIFLFICYTIYHLFIRSSPPIEQEKEEKNSLQTSTPANTIANAPLTQNQTFSSTSIDGKSFELWNEGKVNQEQIKPACAAMTLFFHKAPKVGSFQVKQKITYLLKQLGAPENTIEEITEKGNNVLFSSLIDFLNDKFQVQLEKEELMQAFKELFI